MSTNTPTVYTPLENSFFELSASSIAAIEHLYTEYLSEKNSSLKDIVKQQLTSSLFEVLAPSYAFMHHNESTQQLDKLLFIGSFKDVSNLAEYFDLPSLTMLANLANRTIGDNFIFRAVTEFNMLSVGHIAYTIFDKIDKSYYDFYFEYINQNCSTEYKEFCDYCYLQRRLNDHSLPEEEELTSSLRCNYDSEYETHKAFAFLDSKFVRKSHESQQLYQLIRHSIVDGVLMASSFAAQRELIEWAKVRSVSFTDNTITDKPFVFPNTSLLASKEELAKISIGDEKGGYDIPCCIVPSFDFVITLLEHIDCTPAYLVNWLSNNIEKPLLSFIQADETMLSKLRNMMQNLDTTQGALTVDYNAIKYFIEERIKGYQTDEIELGEAYLDEEIYDSWGPTLSDEDFENMVRNS